MLNAYSCIQNVKVIFKIATITDSNFYFVAPVSSSLSTENLKPSKGEGATSNHVSSQTKL